MRGAGDSLHRWPGGFWSELAHPGGITQPPIWWSPTGTVKALETRGLIAPSKYRTRKGETWPIEYRLTLVGHQFLREAA
jgi:hypothetical protein